MSVLIEKLQEQIRYTLDNTAFYKTNVPDISRVENTAVSLITSEECLIKAVVKNRKEHAVLLFPKYSRHTSNYYNKLSSSCIYELEDTTPLLKILEVQSSKFDCVNANQFLYESKYMYLPKVPFTTDYEGHLLYVPCNVLNFYLPDEKRAIKYKEVSIDCCQKTLTKRIEDIVSIMNLYKQDTIILYLRWFYDNVKLSTFLATLSSVLKSTSVVKKIVPIGNELELDLFSKYFNFVDEMKLF